MTLFEILEFNREIITKLASLGVKAGDCKYIDLYAEYTAMRRRGEKVTYAVSFLAEKYSVEEDGDAYGILEGIARSRHCVVRGSELDIEKASALLLDDFRDGRLGRLTLEYPDQI